MSMDIRQPGLMSFTEGLPPRPRQGQHEAPVPPTARGPSLATRLLVGFLAASFGEKVFLAVGPFFAVRALAALASFLQDAFPLVVLWAWHERCRPGEGTAARPRTAVLLWFPASFLVLISALYTPFLFDLMSFSLDLFSISPSLLAFFGAQFLGPRVLLSLVWCFGIPPLGAWLLPGSWVSVRRPRLLVSAFGLGFLVSAWALPIHPLLQACLNEGRAFLGPRHAGLSPLRLPDPARAGPVPDMTREIRGDLHFTPRFNRVALFVMEGLDTRAFPADRPPLEPGTLPAGWGCERFTSHHSLNLDSFPSLLAILNGVFVPFQAYLHLDRYAFLHARPNLVGCLTANGFATHFVSSFAAHHRRFVPDPADWSTIDLIDDVMAFPEFARVTSNPVETACEDLAVLDRVIEVLAGHPRVFVCQEMVYGHTVEWMDQVGLPPADYYRRYLRSFLAKAGERCLLDGLLVVLTADHGPRNDAMDPGNYRVPLFLLGQGLPDRVEDGFQSHLNLKDLILERAGGIRAPAPAPAILTVGHSGAFVFGRIEAGGRFTFIDQRTLRVASNDRPDAIPAVRDAFQGYLDWFAHLAVDGTGPRGSR